MATLSEVGLGDVEVGCYRSIKPGRKVLLWYADDTVWHENMVALVVGNDDEVVLWTPDGDLYVESIGCKGTSGPTRLRGYGARGAAHRSVRGPIYRFRTAPTDDDIRRVVREAYSLVVKERGSVVPPTVVVDSRGVEVDIDEFYGEPFVRKRIIGKGGAVPSPDPVSPKNAIKVKPATADTVWVAAEPLGGLVLGQEVSLNSDEDVQIGDRTALTLRQGVWVKVDLVPLADVGSYADDRRKLFNSVAADPDPLGNKSPGQLARHKTAAVVGDESEKPQDPDVDDAAHGDVRTLYVDTDEHGERFKRWRNVCSESFTPVYDSKPLEGPCTALHLIKHTERQGGDPRLWLQLWMRTKHIETTDRTYHEMKVLVDVLYYAGTYDQVNIPGFMCLEVVCRRLQAIVDAYANAGKPSWENAKLFTGQGAPEDIVSPVFKTYAAKKNKEELELLQARQRVRELRGSPVVGYDDGSGEVVNSLPKKSPKAKAKQKGRGDDGQADA